MLASMYISILGVKKQVHATIIIHYGLLFMSATLGKQVCFKMLLYYEIIFIGVP